VTVSFAAKFAVGPKIAAIAPTQTPRKHYVGGISMNTIQTVRELRIPDAGPLNGGPACHHFGGPGEISPPPQAGNKGLCTALDARILHAPGAHVAGAALH
jgi:hypothetical protein